MSDSGVSSGRLMSIDTLRGADMCLIMGVAKLIIALSVWLGFGEHSWLADQMRHVEWHGWHMMDGVFPVFMFISGLSWPFSLAKQFGITYDGVKAHLKVIFAKLGVSGRSEAITIALRKHLLKI